jgi:SAM-dependent methyltransferase
MRAASVVASAVQGVLRSILLAGRRALGFSVHLHTEDRRVLEQVILPSYAGRTDIERTLFVGCAAYTQQYGELFRGREYWTIDPSARRRRYGSQRHIVDRLENLGNYVQAEYFDLIVCNGVLGWGLNLLDDADAAFTACHRHLRVDGELLLGWNDIPPRNRVLPEDVPALGRFEPLSFGPLHTARLKVDAPHRHVFDFYRKPLVTYAKGVLEADRNPSGVSFTVTPGAAPSHRDREWSVSAAWVNSFALL